MKTAISIPDDLFRAADRAAKRLGLSRSEFYQRAIARFLDQKDEGRITTALDEVYRDDQPGGLDPALDRMQRASLPREPW
ncbi:MAG: ribbon-helix-helix protein, CopG family [Candidatus Eiseniibacteriota bacterium]